MLEQQGKKEIPTENIFKYKTKLYLFIIEFITRGSRSRRTERGM
jgi:hypothetical protein